MSKEEEPKKWYLKEINIEKKNYSPDDKVYECKISFRNNQYESFDIKLSQERMDKYLSLIMDDINENFILIQNDFMNSLKKSTDNNG